MCGINGFTFPDSTLIRNMNTATAHRGPDETGEWVGEEISFGHNRLAIIDLSPRGHQPMWDAAHEVVIIFNGEIYNYQELRAELASEYTFNSESDTEVILNAYKKYGPECVKKFNGIFAFALWDTRTRELFLARDHAGIKPLYYCEQDNQLIFSSEIKAILEHAVPRHVNPVAFNLYFQLLYIPEPETMFAGIKKLPAAYYARWQQGKGLTMVKYWEPFAGEQKKSYTQTVTEIQDLFRDSVKKQLISDRPVGIFLSGGLDSTAVLGAAQAIHRGPLKTFSVGFAVEDQDHKFNADLVLARKTAEFYQTEHTELLITPTDLWAEVKKIAWHLDEPNFNPTAGAMYLLAKKAKESVAVVLGGDGADELFGGYPRYYYSRIISKYQRLGITGKALAWCLQKIGLKALGNKLRLSPNQDQVLAFLAQKNEGLRTFIAPHQFLPQAAADHLAERYFKTPDAQIDFENYFMKIDREGWLRDESLHRTDTMSMAHGVEARVPILDYRLIELGEKIPVPWKISLWQNSKNFQGKKIWKDAILPFLPPHVLNQPKRGWFTPMAKWVRTDLKDPVAAVLEEAKTNSEFFTAEGIDTLWQGHLSGKRYNLNSIWAIVMWQLWYNRYIKKDL